jgi:superfamily I DNA/RNA helicase
MKDISKDRDDYTKRIIETPSAKKIIVAGAGTGKTYTFGTILRKNPKSHNLVLTFIKKLKAEMEEKLKSYAEVYTFHEFSLRRLRSIAPDFQLYPKIYSILESDSDYKIQDIGGYFQRLDVDNDTVKYCLNRMTYYRVNGFDDAIYILLKNIRSSNVRIRKYGHILIDEFQDFNALEVSLIKELEQYGNIVIVGDDEQAIYSFRNVESQMLV